MPVRFFGFFVSVNFMLSLHSFYQSMFVFIYQTKEFGGSGWQKVLAGVLGENFAPGSPRNFSKQPYILTTEQKILHESVRHLLARSGLSPCGCSNKKWRIRAPHPVQALTYLGGGGRWNGFATFLRADIPYSYQASQGSTAYLVAHQQTFFP